MKVEYELPKPKHDIPMYHIKDLKSLDDPRRVFQIPIITTSSPVQIIETNVSIHNETNKIMDHQSRIVEADSWEEYIDYYKNRWRGHPQKEFKCLTGLVGNTLPQLALVYDLEYDDYHLSCSIYDWAGIETKKLAYLINHENEGKPYER